MSVTVTEEDLFQLNGALYKNVVPFCFSSTLTDVTSKKILVVVSGNV